MANLLSQAGVKISEKNTRQEELKVFGERLTAATSRPWVTMSLMALNVIIFGLVGIDSHNFSPPELTRWGANFGPLTVNCHQWWRLLACCFLHFSILHLLFNMYALFLAGRLTERLFGNWFFLLIYLGCGLTASLASLWFHPAVVSAGASGAIFGVYGALLAYLAREGGGLPGTVTGPVFNSAVVFVIWNLYSGTWFTEQ